MTTNPGTLARRTLLGAGLAGTAALTGCGGGSGGSSDGLRAAWYGGNPVHEAIGDALAAFADAHPDLTVSPERGSFDDYWDTIATQVASGKGPDVMRMSMSYFSEYAGRGALLDLADAVPDAIRTGDLDPDVATSGEVDGGLFGIGQSSITHAGFLDATAVQAVGGVVPVTGWTWDEFGEFARGYASSTPDGVWGTADSGGNLQIFEVFARQHGSEVFADDGGLAVDPDVLAEWFELWEGLRRDGAAPGGDVTAESTSFETSTLVRGVTPVQFGWVQQVTFYQPLVEVPVTLIGVPTADGSAQGQFLKALDLWSVSATTEDPDGARDLVDFLVNDDAAITAIGVTLGVPPSQRARDLLAADPESPAGRCIAYVEELRDAVGESPAAWPAGYSEVLGAVERANQDVTFGRATPSEAASTVAEEATRAVS